jgi:hypothetical protein
MELASRRTVTPEQLATSSRRLDEYAASERAQRDSDAAMAVLGAPPPAD